MNIVGELKCYLGKDYAQLKFSESKTSFSIDIVNVPAEFRNNGIGTMLIDHIILMADNMGKNIQVTVRPLGQADEEKLQKLIVFYQKFGFEVLDRGITAAYMSRKTRK